MDTLKKNIYIIGFTLLIVILFMAVFFLNRRYRIEPMEYLNYELKDSPVSILNSPDSDGFYQIPEGTIKIAGNTPYGYVFRRHVLDHEFFFEPIQVEYKLVNNAYFVRPSIVITSDLELMLFPNDTLYVSRKEFHFFACPWYEKAVKKKLNKLNTLKHQKNTP